MKETLKGFAQTVGTVIVAIIVINLAKKYLPLPAAVKNLLG